MHIRMSFQVESAERLSFSRKWTEQMDPDYFSIDSEICMFAVKPVIKIQLEVMGSRAVHLVTC
jgi:hypothetical protein